jgi:hypothetical protein
MVIFLKDFKSLRFADVLTDYQWRRQIIVEEKIRQHFKSVLLTVFSCFAVVYWQGSRNLQNQAKLLINFNTTRQPNISRPVSATIPLFPLNNQL